MGVIKNKKTNRNKKILQVGGAAIVFLLVAGLIYVFVHKSPSKTVGITNPPSAKDVKQDEDVNSQTKRNFIESPPATSTPAKDGSARADIQVSARQETDGSITVIAKLYGVSYGTCNLTITNNGQTITKTAQVVYQPEFSSCAGFSIPFASLGGGNWNIGISITGGNLNGEASTSLEVK